MAYDWVSTTIFDSTYSLCSGHSLYALDANKLFVVFQDWKYNSNEGALLFSKSIDGGTSWSIPVVVAYDYGTIWQGEKTIWASLNGQNIYIVHQGSLTPGDSNPYSIIFSKSSNGGISFSSSIVDSYTYHGNYFFKPNMDVYDSSGQYIYLVYPNDGWSWFSVHFAYSSDYGSSWTTKLIRNVDAVENFYAIKALSISKIYIAGNLKVIGGSYKTHFAKTDDTGNSWNFTDISTVLTNQGSMFVKDENTILIPFGGDITNKHLLLAKSTNGGSSFDITTVDSDDVYPAPLYSIGSPGGQTVMIAYEDGKLYRLKFAVSTDLGGTWQTELADDYNGEPCAEDCVSMSLIVSCTFIVHGTYNYADPCGCCLRLTKASLQLPISSILMYKFRPVVLV